MNSIAQPDKRVKRFAEIMQAMWNGEISQAEAERQVAALNEGMTYLRDQALLMDPREVERERARRAGLPPPTYSRGYK